MKTNIKNSWSKMNRKTKYWLLVGMPLAVFWFIGMLQSFGVTFLIFLGGFGGVTLAIYALFAWLGKIGQPEWHLETRPDGEQVWIRTSIGFGIWF